LRGLTTPPHGTCGAGTASSHRAGLGTEAQLLPAGPGRGRQRDDDAVLLVACASCERYRVGDVWTTLAAVPQSGRVSHGVCPACLAAVLG
jgi:hypothetical protein